MFNPFILMDIAESYPWRGHISGEDLTASATTQVAAFMGSAAAAQFSFGSGTINFAGTEWSYRRLVLHYAMLCSMAGGVDAFLIGSELRGLTSLRSAVDVYPFVSALVQLAADVKSILPDAKISYAADWSEYFGHHPQDGSGDVYFNLDPLWSSTAIDFIGIDNYFPLTDWRDGQTHLDALAGASSIYDQTYLQHALRVAKISIGITLRMSARDNQMRSTITDGVYNKPWVFRAKDLKKLVGQPTFQSGPQAWRQRAQRHGCRNPSPSGSLKLAAPQLIREPINPTRFMMRNHPIALCPIILMAAADDAMQLAFITAASTYWQMPGAQNPDLHFLWSQHGGCQQDVLVVLGCKAISGVSSS